jgi:hypothetical protein
LDETPVKRQEKERLKNFAQQNHQTVWSRENVRHWMHWREYAQAYDHEKETILPKRAYANEKRLWSWRAEKREC